jgi:hypothetical protein
MADVLVVHIYGRDAGWYGCLSKDEVLISYGIKATFNNYLKPVVIMPCRVEGNGVCTSVPCS